VPDISELLPQTGVFADNRFREPQGGSVESVVDPSTGALLGVVGDAGVADVDAAVSAARRAVDGGGWSRLSGRDRSDALYRLVAELTAYHDRILAVLVAETGCPVTSARGHQVGIPLRHLDYWAEAARRPELLARSPQISRRSDGSGVLGSWVVRREPYGVVAAITPYNFPLLQNVMKIGPALAAGNAVVLKPSPLTPYSTFLLAEAVARADLPQGAVNVVTGGADVGVALCDDTRVDLISFTGSAGVGMTIARQAAARMVPVVLELGGKSPLIVCADADLDLAARAGAQSTTYHAGQGCALTTRHLVARDVRDAYLERLSELVSRVVVGDPTDPATGMGPLIRPAAVDRVRGYVDEAQAQGAKLVTGGHPGPPTAGFFYAPTVLADVDNSARIAREEVFGPVAVVIDTESDDHAVELANDSSYGLAGHVVSADTARAFELACRLRAGSVDINGGPGYTNPDVPFGGYKDSGLGRENGSEGIDEYTQFKTIKYPAR
jgi:aldehyde dehydrogenase (NAD+)